MPIIQAHLGEWEGEYIHVDADGQIIDRHASHLLCTAPDDGTYDVRQVNTYTWDDGRQAQFEFSGVTRDGICYFDNDRIKGEMSQIDELVIILTWSYKDDMSNYLYELIQLSRDGKRKFRTWHWMDNDRIVKRTLIRETKKS
ncbi:DUF3598 family protein [Dactylosporangium sucinum]|uniref:DUF3598 domain-containing protein n=1 Tax=Dactylosporangium sucinum TaxID=1424081 RepID=A0A917WZS9_9ACTN|nr:DUF3598 family protein [Dactylosporangium sucinum]GGM45930.1 hypothetical protein GCM10007977_054580 [Dactylosporangium sucinum]